MMQNNPFQMIQQFAQFRANFRGDPEQEVRNLVASGRISQAQLNELQTMAAQFQRIMNSFGMK